MTEGLDDWNLLSCCSLASTGFWNAASVLYDRCVDAHFNRHRKCRVPLENKPKHAVRSFLIELLVYSGLIIVYVLLVIRLLGTWLNGLFEHNRTHYAIAALLLIIGQGVALEMLTTLLLKLIRPRI